MCFHAKKLKCRKLPEVKVDSATIRFQRDKSPKLCPWDFWLPKTLCLTGRVSPSSYDFEQE